MKALTGGITLVIILGAAALPVSAQEQTAGERLRCDAPNGGTIRGVVLNDSTHQPIGGRGVSLRPADGDIPGWCFSATDSLGHFEINDVPPGEYRVAPGSLGFRRFEPVPVVVHPGAEVEVEMRLWPGNLVADCWDMPACADILRPRPDLVAHLGGEERIQEAVWRTSIALAGKSWESDWIYCADVQNERVRVVLEQRIPRLVSASECEMPEPPEPGEPFIRQVTHTPTGDAARIVRVSAIDEVPEGHSVRSSYIAGSLHAEGWRCLFREEDEGWTAEWCHLVWIS